MSKRKKPPVFTVVSGTEEWQGLYVDGKLVMQDHSLRVRHLLDYLEEQGLIVYDGRQVDQEKLNDVGVLPDTLAELDTWGEP